MLLKYLDAGVDVELGDKTSTIARDMAASTSTPGVMGKIGGFGGLFDIGKGCDDPILVSSTDGVGTKLLVAQRLNVHDTVGIDLVAMCVNDVLAMGAKPLFFLDYIATGKLDETVFNSVISGIVEGCKQAGCALIGGETAEMPGMYDDGKYDLAGFCVGIVERSEIIDGSRVREGDMLIGIPSSGLHSNGYSLVRKLCDKLDWDMSYTGGVPLRAYLIEPTKIYTRECETLKNNFDVKAYAHITGGGLTKNLSRVIPHGLGCVIESNFLLSYPIFKFLMRRGEMSYQEMLSTFNCGVGMVAIVSREDADKASKVVFGYKLGEIVKGSGVKYVR